STLEMRRLFADYPQALAHTGYIARQVELELPLGRRRFPTLPLPPGQTAYSRLWQLASAGAVRRYQPLTPAVTARLQQELAAIGALGFADYFLIAWDIV